MIVTSGSHSRADTQRVHKGKAMNVSGLPDIGPGKYKQPQTEGLPEEGLPVAELTALAPKEGLEMPIENFGDLVDQVSEESNGEIDSLIANLNGCGKS